MVKIIEYKAGLYGVEVVKASEAYSSQMCHGCGEVWKTNRVHWSLYGCDCGWRTHVNENGAANLFRAAYKGSPVEHRQSSGEVATPVVVPIRLVGIRSTNRQPERFELSEMPPEFIRGRASSEVVCHPTPRAYAC
jgi:transposase